MFVIDAYRNGSMILSKYADQDDDEPAQTVTLSAVSKEALVQFWTALSKGDFDGIRRKCPEWQW